MKRNGVRRVGAKKKVYIMLVNTVIGFESRHAAKPKGVAVERRYDLQLRVTASGPLTRRKDAESCKGKYRREAKEQTRRVAHGRSVIG